MDPVILTSKPTTEIPLPQREAEPNPGRELRELTEAIRADTQLAPDEYLEEVRVACGGE